MRLTSSDFEDGGEIPVDLSCHGSGRRPALFWSEVPAEAKSLAISVVDPDAPSGEFIHWVCVDIPMGATGISSNEDIGKELPNTAGKANYISPCPPSGRHRYVFTLFALDTEIADRESNNFNSTIQAHAIEEAKLIGLYGKR